MIVVDTSAVMAIVRREPDAELFANAIQESDALMTSAGTLLELGTVVLHKRGPGKLGDLFRFLEFSRISVVPLSEDQSRRAIDAYARYGKGTGHKAQLNFGDCFSYALAASLDCSLLYKGEDFALTDIRSAL